MRKMDRGAFLRMSLLAVGVSVILVSLTGCYPPAYSAEDAYYYFYAPDILIYPPTITFYLKDRDVPFYYQGLPYYHYYPYNPFYPPDYGNPFYRSYH